MNDEIKEILDKWKCYIGLTKKFTTNEYEMLRVEDIDKILDYITNLQQENERLKEWKEDLLKENIELEDIRKEAIEFIDEIISSTKGVINDYSYHKDYNKHTIELLKEDVEMYKHIKYILQNGSEKDE